MPGISKVIAGCFILAAAVCVNVHADDTYDEAEDNHNVGDSYWTNQWLNNLDEAREEHSEEYKFSSEDYHRIPRKCKPGETPITGVGPCFKYIDLRPCYDRCPAFHSEGHPGYWHPDYARFISRNSCIDKCKTYNGNYFPDDPLMKRMCRKQNKFGAYVWKECEKKDGLNDFFLDEAEDNHNVGDSYWTNQWLNNLDEADENHNVGNVDWSLVNRL